MAKRLESVMVIPEIVTTVEYNHQLYCYDQLTIEVDDFNDALKRIPQIERESSIKICNLRLYEQTRVVVNGETLTGKRKSGQIVYLGGEVRSTAELREARIPYFDPHAADRKKMAVLSPHGTWIAVCNGCDIYNLETGKILRSVKPVQKKARLPTLTP